MSNCTTCKHLAGQESDEPCASCCQDGKCAGYEEDPNAKTLCDGCYEAVVEGGRLCLPCAEEAAREEHDKREIVSLRARVAELERERDAAVEAHAQLLSRIAADGTLDAMERAKAAEQRAKRLEGAVAAVRAANQVWREWSPSDGRITGKGCRCGCTLCERLDLALRFLWGEVLVPADHGEKGRSCATCLNQNSRCLDCGYHPESDGFPNWKPASAALAASGAEAPARCRCGHDAYQHYEDSEARGRPCRECGCLGMESDEAPAREGGR